MRHTLLLLAMAGLATVAKAGEANAQVRGVTYGESPYVAWYPGGPFYGAYYGGPRYGGLGSYRFGFPRTTLCRDADYDIGSGFAFSGRGYYPNVIGHSPYDAFYAQGFPSVYDWSIDTSTSPGFDQDPLPPYTANVRVDYSYYPPSYPLALVSYNLPVPKAKESATIRVLVSRPDAQIWFGASATSQQGTERVFQSPPLDPGKDYKYAVKAQWLENGQPVIRESHVSVRAGQTAAVRIDDK